ncbi:hypothetical protein Q8F55_007563 [Vanrija albida]|uniref:Uncharacterized protein n=1 Tax=Vanrija albida TaxID=181172 RepID=A0ABR3PTV9_9TREE
MPTSEHEASYTWPAQPPLSGPGLPVPPWSVATPVSGSPPPGNRYAPQRRSLVRAFPVRRERTPPLVASGPSESGAEATAGGSAPSVAAWVAAQGPAPSMLNARAPPYRPSELPPGRESPPHRRDSSPPRRELPPAWREPYHPRIGPPLPYRRQIPAVRPPACPFPVLDGSGCSALRSRMARTHPDDYEYHLRYNYSRSHCLVIFPIPSDVAPADIRALMEEEVGPVFSVKVTDGVGTIVFEETLAFRARFFCEWPRRSLLTPVTHAQIDGQELIQFVVPPVRRAAQLAWDEQRRRG